MSRKRIVKKIQGGNERIRIKQRNEGNKHNGNENNNIINTIQNVPPPPPPRHPKSKSKGK